MNGMEMGLNKGSKISQVYNVACECLC